MAKKKIDENELFSTDHDYRCLRCGVTYKNPIGNFYQSQYSELFLKNSKYASLCIECVNEMFDHLENRYDTKTACMIMCQKLDIVWDYSLFTSINNVNTGKFKMGLYTRQLGKVQYRNKDFGTSIVNGELRKTDEDVYAQRETKWLRADLKNKERATEIFGYDPFADLPDDQRKKLFSYLMPYLEDEDTINDSYKLSQIRQIVINNYQIHNYDVRISKMNIVKDQEIIDAMISAKNKLVTNNDKIAKENEISVKNRSNKDVGKQTLTHLMKDLRGKNFEEAEADYYDQLRSAGTRWAIDMSMESIKNNAMFDESDKIEILNINRELIDKLNQELDEIKEENRRLKVENNYIRLIADKCGIKLEDDEGDGYEEEMA